AELRSAPARTVRTMVMKAFAKNRKSKANQDSGVADDGLDLEFDEQLAEDDAVADDAHADFIERLGDLDRFIGTGATAPTPVARVGALVDDRATRRLFDARDHAVAVAEPPRSEQSEADEFLERLGDLDRFVGGAVDAPAIAWSDAPAA